MQNRKYIAITTMLGIFLILLMPGTSAKSQAGADPGISASLKWSERMALSIMKRNPEPWMIDFMDRPVWSYPQGLVLHAFEGLSQKKDSSRYQAYIRQYADRMISEEGVIETYQQESFNIDMINAGKILFNLYDKTGEEKYRLAIERLRHQLRWQPRTTDGGYWHKLRYPWQMWLDGAYMGAPFLARYAVTYGEPEALEDVAQQLMLMEKHMRDARTGLLYHGWDESRLQPWANPETGTSPNFWGRAMGWYAMALVDALDYFPEKHPRRQELIHILQRMLQALEPFQDRETGLWYQVIDQGSREGNYLEASASAMFVYAMAKGVNQNYIDKSFLQIAEKAYEGIIGQLIEVEENGEVHLHQVCAVAGLGGSAERDGSYAYYISEPVRTNDPKGTGPFILASLELNK